MAKIAKTYLKYGIPNNLAFFLETNGISVTTFRITSKKNLMARYGLDEKIVDLIKSNISRKPIDGQIVQKLLENSNFVCCVCKGVKSDGYIIHHIREYSISR